MAGTSSLLQAGDEEGPEGSDGSFTQRLQQALRLSLSSDAHSPDAGGGDENLCRTSAVITPNSAAAAAFDSALVTPGHSRGGSVHIAGIVPGLSAPADPSLQHWGSPPRTELASVAERPTPPSFTSEGPTALPEAQQMGAVEPAGASTGRTAQPAAAADNDASAVRRLVEVRPSLKCAESRGRAAPQASRESDR